MDKLYFSISEVSKIVDEEPHILRYWEKEFDQIKPKKNRSGNRIYLEKDIKIIKTIKKLLREDRLSLKGAKEQLKNFDSGVIGDSLFGDEIFPKKKVIRKTSKTDSLSKLDMKELIELRNLLQTISDVLK